MRKQALLLLASVWGSLWAQTPYIQAVDEYRPAPGQFVNTLPEATADDTPETMAAKCTARLANNARQMVTLGAWGGYIVFHFDHPVANIEGQRDFAVWGNAFDYAAEPAIVMVSIDRNANGRPDDEWYELRGSEYDNALTVHGYELTYSYDALKDVAWTDNQGQTGTVPRNSFHQQEYFPLWIADEERLTFSGCRLPDNAELAGKKYLLNAFSYGYADNLPNDDAEGCSMDIGWAVDSEGRSVSLTHIDFVKCYTAINQVCGTIGETSSEIVGAEDLHLDLSLQQAASVKTLALPAQQASVLTDLLGRRLNAMPSRGLYIKNGKKLIINK